jgi:HEAT repeat protein
LAELGRRGAEPELLAAFALDADPDVAATAVRAIGEGRFAEAPAFLARQSAAPDPQRRHAAVLGWTALGGAEAARALAGAARDHDRAVSCEAVAGLGRLATADSVAELLDLASIPSLQGACIDQAIAGGPSVIPYVAQGLQNSKLDVRRIAVEILTRFATPAAIEALSAVTNDPQPAIRHAARHAHDRLRTPPAATRSAESEAVPPQGDL